MLRASHAAAQQQQQRKEYVAKQQRWLLFLRHCAKCQAAEGQCTYGQSCTVAKELWRHILTCADPNCEYPRCCKGNELFYFCSQLFSFAASSLWHFVAVHRAACDCPPILIPSLASSQWWQGAELCQQQRWRAIVVVPLSAGVLVQHIYAAVLPVQHICAVKL